MKNIIFKKVLIALDYNPTAKKVAEVGYSIANAMGADCLLVHILSTPIIYTSVNYDPIMGFSGFEALENYQLNAVLRPINIIKNNLSIKEVKSNLINIALGLATNYIIDKFPSISIENKFPKLVKRILKWIN